ncbi:MAG: phospholipase D-like domain-containing protein, partial [Pseudomonadota bacterium]
SPERPWRDTHLRIEGPAVSDFQQAFLADWNDNGDDGDYDDAEPANGAPEPAGNDSVRLATAGDQRASMTIYESYLRAFLKARRRIWITQAYFAPDRRFLRTLTRAAKSGVDVRLVLPGHSDSRAMIAAARSYYSALLRAGARVFERRNVLLHAKTALIDDYWVTIGSSNLDNRSFSFNRELNAVVVSSRVASAMERLFLDDVARSDEIDATEWRRRPLLQRAAQRIARSARRWL